jgi:hypothetical protein
MPEAETISREVASGSESGWGRTVGSFYGRRCKMG